MPDPQAPMPPVLFGKYRLTKKLAQGGMAEIYVAKSTGAGGFEKTVVVKKILPRLAAHQKFINMFINEAKVTSVLNHSNIVQIYDFGRIGQDYFIAMEFVDGKDLRTIIRACRERGRKLPLEFVLYTGVQITKGLEFAHTRTDSSTGEPMNLIHRDVSPQNVLLSRHGEIKITDFGIAKATGGLSETVANEIKGNFGYMPPEQAGGGNLDPRTDVYATAMCLYELCTLRNPFADSNLLTVLSRIKDMVPPPPSSFNPAVSRTVDQIILRGLEKNPDARFATAGEMCAALSEELFPSPTELVQASFAAFLNSLFPPEVHPSRVNMERSPLPTPPPQASLKSAGWGAASPLPPPAALVEVIDDDTDPGRPPLPLVKPAMPGAEGRRPTPPPRPANVVVNGNSGSSPDSDLRFARKIRDLANLARLRLDVAPANVEVWIDQNKISEGAPVEIQTSAKVEHRLELKAEGFSDFSTTFVLSPGEIRDFQIVLAERPRTQQ